MTLPGGYPSDGLEGQQDTTNPAWNEFLDVVPKELHGQVTPLLEKWDKGVQERFTKVQSEYEPWKEFNSAGVDPDTARFALNLLNSLNDNPQMVYKAIGDYYKLGGVDPKETEQGRIEPKPDQDDPYAAKIANLERNNAVVAQALIQQHEARQAAEQDAALDAELSGLRKQYGDYNEQYVLAMMQNGLTAKQAVENYFNFREAEIKRYVPKPLIMGGNGGMAPGNSVDVRKLSESGTKDLVVQMLQATAQQNRQ